MLADTKKVEKHFISKAKKSFCEFTGEEHVTLEHVCEHKSHT